jgi:hypothetical protein
MHIWFQHIQQFAKHNSSRCHHYKSKHDTDSNTGATENISNNAGSSFFLLLVFEDGLDGVGGALLGVNFLATGSLLVGVVTTSADDGG